MFDDFMIIYRFFLFCIAQEIVSNQSEITALAFSNDGKELATYSARDLTLHFWRTQMSVFSLFSSSPRCLSTHKACDSPHSPMQHLFLGVLDLNGWVQEFGYFVLFWVLPTPNKFIAGFSPMEHFPLPLNLLFESLASCVSTNCTVHRS
jgi:WD40 repeat protein